MKEFSHVITSSESPKKYHEVIESGKGKQASYQVGKDAGKYFLKNGIVYFDGEISNDDYKNYRLKDEYELHMSDKILTILDDKYRNESFDVIFTLKKDSKFDIRKKINREQGNDWFSELYDKSVEGDLFVVEVDIETKIIKFDIKSKYNLNEKNLINESKQKIYYGAPGTGKSYKLNCDSLMFEQDYRRVTFHPNMLYGEFIGSFKPFPTKEKNTPITYKFVAGALIKSIVSALKNPDKPYLLIIEEINRANVSATFGETFQLLDRNKDGQSEYPIDISDDLRLYLNEEIFENQDLPKEIVQNAKVLLNNGLVFPKNLYIWASMNSSDQGVLPLDTAFKRRWDFEYFSVDDAYYDNEELFKDFASIYLNDNKTIDWNTLRMFINDRLSYLNIPEDKLLGPFFISKNVLESDERTVTKTFENKVLMYLFEDIGSQYRNKIFNVSKMRLSTIRDEFKEKGIEIFKDASKIATYNSTKFGDESSKEESSDSIIE